ncbi:hypothetical protein J6590_050987 [Homalodisca vitripennis]|nr:hypothetical protein J6590_050987 [Homalodisca vitripennis]
MSGVLNGIGVQLDLVFAIRQDFSVTFASDPLLPFEDYHPPLCFTGTMGSINPLIQRPQYVHDTRKCNLESVKNEILGGAIVVDYDCRM